MSAPRTADTVTVSPAQFIWWTVAVALISGLVGANAAVIALLQSGWPP